MDSKYLKLEGWCPYCVRFYNMISIVILGIVVYNSFRKVVTIHSKEHRNAVGCCIGDTSHNRKHWLGTNSTYDLMSRSV